MKFDSLKDYFLKKLQIELPKELFYHGAHHTEDVLNSIVRIGEGEEVSAREMTILKTAALFHDAGFLDQYSDNEEAATVYARQTLPAFDYEEDDIDVICAIIMATRHDIKPRNLLEEIMCDADHDYLGRKDYKRIAASLYKELAEYGYVYNEREWINMQVSFLAIKHTYYTEWAKKNRQTTKERHIERLKEKLNF